MGWRRRGWDWDWGPYYPKSQPRAAKGGIKAQSKRGEFGTSWWAKRWIDVLHSFHIGARLDRGRSYARSGQVLNIDVSKGLVRAQVQGSRPKPYDVKIETNRLSDADWRKVIKHLADQPLYTAKLLAGEMPQDIEPVFTAAGVSLFPARRNDLKTACSCPDSSNPCKHIAAVYYLLGEEFDRDPFLIFTLRGLTREELIERLEHADETGRVALSQPAAEPVAASEPLAGEPLPADPAQFWNGQELGEDAFGEVVAPPVAAALPRRLGGFPFWRGAQPFLAAVEPAYRAATPRALDLFVSQQAQDAEASDSGLREENVKRRQEQEKVP
jgi:uncharacterized Zn finger protein